MQVRVPMSLVVRRRGNPVLLGWLLALAGATATIVSLVKRELAFVVVGLAALALGVWLLRRGIEKGFRAYRWRGGR